MTVYFIVDVDTMMEQVIAFSNDDGISYVDYNGESQNTWHLFPRDTTGPSHRYYRCISADDGIYMGIYKLIIQDVPTWSGTLRFSGRIRARVWAPYPDDCTMCREGDASDNEFTVTR